MLNRRGFAAVGLHNPQLAARVAEDNYTGLADLRAWLAEQGFRFARDTHNGGACNWYAYRASSLEAPECECNEGKRIQLVIYPFHFSTSGIEHASVEIDLTGEAGGVWWKLRCYSVRPDELRERLADIEAGLVAAWRALPRAAISAQGADGPKE